MTTTRILIIGVGGQGTLLASRILGSIAIAQGYEVKVSEVHGMSQRGGSVVTYVQYGDEVFSPIIGKGEADIVLAFEPLEAARALPYLKRNGRLIVNTQRINPMPVIIGAAKYPENVLKKLKKTADIKEVDALSLAQKAGSVKTANVALIGVLAKDTDVPYEVWLDVLQKTIPEKFLKMNIAAFDYGYQYKE